MADQKKQREHLRAYTSCARALELHEVAINVLEVASTAAGQRAISILKTDQRRLVKALDAAAAKLGAPYPTPGVTVDRPLGCALAMRVMQSDMYRQLDDAERADCNELVQQNLEWFKRDSADAVVGTLNDQGETR